MNCQFWASNFTGFYHHYSILKKKGMKGDPKSDSNYHEYKELTEERFYEILDLSDMLYKDLITPEEFGEKVREDELADFRIMAQKKNYDYSKRKK